MFLHFFKPFRFLSFFVNHDIIMVKERWRFYNSIMSVFLLQKKVAENYLLIFVGFYSFYSFLARLKIFFFVDVF